MGILADHQIEAANFITPFAPQQHRPGVLSFGLSSYGYDVRIGFKFKIFSNVHCGIVDPKNFDPRSFVDIDITPTVHDWICNSEESEHLCVNCGKNTKKPKAELECFPRGNFILIPPNSFALGETVETLSIPRDILCVVVGKSTLARCGIIVNVTPLEPQWTGKVTIEISNTTPLPAKIYAGEGIAQALFFRADAVCRTSYADKAGIYQSQDGLTLPKVAK